jgi:hypothetical protein
MSLFILSQIEERIHQLSLTEQLWLIERLAQHLRAQLLAPQTREEALAAMAADPAIQREIQAIEEEFAPAAADGLEPL